MAGEWKSIDTAPRDGTEILVGRFVKKCPMKRNNIVEVDRWHFRKGVRGFTGWAHFNEYYWPATHWMPLPPKPEVE